MKVLILIGKLGSGTHEIENMLRDKYGYKKIISCTTGNVRAGETGRYYRFMSKNEFHEHVNNKEMAEWTMDKDTLYGTLEYDLISDEKLVAVRTPEGAEAIKKRFPNAFIVHVNPSTKTALLRAIEHEKEMDPGTIHKISNQAMTDYYLFNNLAADYTIANERMSILEDVVRKIVNAHDSYIEDRKTIISSRPEQHIAE